MDIITCQDVFEGYNKSGKGYMAGYIIDENTLDLESGWLCLDYANTAEWHASDQPIEKLNTYADLVGWAQSVGLIDEPDAEHWLTEGHRRPDEAAEMLLWAVDLREALYRAFTALSLGNQPAPDDLVIVNRALADALSHLRLTARPGGISWEWERPDVSLGWFLWPVSWSAADLLTSTPDLERVGVCQDEGGCGWLFLDTSKNHSRRYCGYSCANRAKAQRHYARQKQQADDSSD
jgi:predicted RNA-binding Zn ribbon-like protein